MSIKHDQMFYFYTENNNVMKKYTILSAFAILPLFIIAANPPQQVVDAFKSKFPNAEEVRWEKEGDLAWEAEFEVDEIDQSAVFSSDGKWQETEKEMNISDLPAPIAESFRKNFPKAKMKNAEQIEHAQKGMMYEIEYRVGFRMKEELYTADGKQVEVK
jgi:hypothetical protein